MKKFFKKVLRRYFEWNFYMYCKIFRRAKIVGKENIPKEGPVVFCGNHRTFLDPVLIQSTAGRDMRFLAKDVLYKHKFLAFLGWVFESIPVKRDAAKDVTALKEALKTLKNGGCIGIFPEGTRNGLEKGESVKEGAAFMALRSGAKVVPIGISGDKGPFSKVTIKYGEPIDLSIYDKNDKEAPAKATELIMNKIIELTK